MKGSLWSTQYKHGLESTNRVIKDEGTYRVKLSLGRFLEVVKTNIVERWSKERDEAKPFSKIFADKVSIDHKLWVQSFHLSIDERPTCYITDKQKKKLEKEASKSLQKDFKDI